MKIITIILIGLLLSVSLVSAMKIDFFYHPECPHCKNVIPTINFLMNKYKSPFYEWRVFDTSEPVSYNVQGVPTIRIKTDDCRNIEITGDQPILKQLPCELQEMSTKECMTYIDGEGTRGGSLFKP